MVAIYLIYRPTSDMLDSRYFTLAPRMGHDEYQTLRFPAAMARGERSPVWGGAGVQGRGKMIPRALFSERG